MRKPLPMLAAVVLIAMAVLIFRARFAGPNLNAPAILVQVQQLNRLTTVRYTIQKVVGIREQKQPIGEESILLILQARVEAGLDLSSMRAEDVKVRPDGSVVIRVPDAKILNVAVDEKDTKVWDRQKTWWTPWVPYDLDLEQRARMAGLESAKQAAIEMGILANAQQNAATSIKALLGLGGLKNVVVIAQGSS